MTEITVRLVIEASPALETFLRMLCATSITLPRDTGAGTALTGARPLAGGDHDIASSNGKGSPATAAAPVAVPKPSANASPSTASAVQTAPRPSVPRETAPPSATPAKLPIFSPERNAVLMREWPRLTSVDGILRMLHALPGPQVPRERVAIQATKLKVRRPPLDAISVPPPAAVKAVIRPISPDRVPAHFIAIRDFAGKHGLTYDGANMDEVDKLCDRVGRQRYIQVAE